MYCKKIFAQKSVCSPDYKFPDLFYEHIKDQNGNSWLNNHVFASGRRIPPLDPHQNGSNGALKLGRQTTQATTRCCWSHEQSCTSLCSHNEMVCQQEAVPYLEIKQGAHAKQNIEVCWVLNPSACSMNCLHGLQLLSAQFCSIILQQLLYCNFMCWSQRPWHCDVSNEMQVFFLRWPANLVTVFFAQYTKRQAIFVKGWQKM